MKKRQIKITIISLIALIVVVAAGFGIKSVMPVRLTPTADYFSQQAAGHMTSDELMDYRALQQFMRMPTTIFKDYEDFPPSLWKYGLAFTSYALANIPYIEEGQRAAAGYYIDMMIQRMKLKVVWEDWQQQGFGDDPITQHNIMYKGHLNLMYGLHQLVSGSTKWDKDLVWLSNNISDEIDATPYSGVTCEPDCYFSQCNSIGIYSLLVYDKLHGTNHSKEINSWLTWMKAQMIDSKYGVLSRVYHPESGYIDQEVSGYGNAWTIAFLHAIDPAFAESLYPKFKKTFVKEMLSMYAMVSENPGGPPDSQATMFALITAKEMGDQPLFDKLLNSIEMKATPTVDGYSVNYKGITMISRGGLLFGKVNVGLGKMLTEKPKN